MGKHDTIKRNARCPFFDSAGTKSVRCESPVRRAYNVTVFFDKAAAEDYVHRVCCGDYEKCAYYKALMAVKYRN